VNIQHLALAVMAIILGGVVVQAADAYPLTTCVVSGKKIGSMGTPVTIYYKDIEVRFCCAGCVKKFDAEPATYLVKLGKKDPLH